MRNKRNLLYYLGRGKRKIQSTTVGDTLLLVEDDQNQMKAASTSSSTITGSSSQTLDIELDWVRNWEQHTTGYQDALQLNRHTHDNEKCASPLKRGPSRAKAETISSLPKYIILETNDVISICGLLLTFFFLSA